MKAIKNLLLVSLVLLVVTSCVSIRVTTDFDTQKEFDGYQTYAFYKTGIDKAQISDLDKKRILKAIEAEMSAKGFTVSEKPDVLVSIFTKERSEVDIYNNMNMNMGWGFGWGMGWNPWMGNPWMWNNGGFRNSVSTRTEGVLYIDLIDGNTNELVWQGRGIGTLKQTSNIAKKEAQIKEFVAQILQNYPPSLAQN